MNKLLSVSIPTYNRPKILEENLQLMLPELIKHDIHVYVSDDSTNDETQNIIQTLTSIYPHVHYTKNAPSLGHDANCVQSLTRPETQYIWYLGDSIVIEPNAFQVVLDILTQDKFDFIVVSTQSRPNDVPSQHYQDANLFFKDLSWHATLTGATIYRKETIQSINTLPYLNSNFMQLGLLLEGMLQSSRGLYWINQPLISPNQNKGASYWKERIFKVFAYDWTVFIQSLPSQYNDNKIDVIKSHSHHTGLFGIKNLIKLRANGVLTYQNIKPYYESFKLASSTPMIWVNLIMLFPSWMLKPIMKYVSNQK